MSVDRTTKANQSLQRIAGSEALDPVEEASQPVSLKIPLHITVRLGSAAAGIEAVIATEPETPSSSVNVKNARSALHEGPLTFRDHFLSLYQSAVADLAGKLAADKKSGLESTAPGRASVHGTPSNMSVPAWATRVWDQQRYALVHTVRRCGEE